MRSGTTTYTYNDLNQLVSITARRHQRPSSTARWVSWSARTTATARQTNYLVDPTGLGNVVAGYDGSGSLIAGYNYGLGLVSQTGPSGTGYYDFDANGNTIGITGAGGTYVNQYSYLPFGETTTISAALPNPFTVRRAVGSDADRQRSVVHANRFYSAASGVFSSPDPLGLPGRSLYKYAANNPVQFIDPLGLYDTPGGTSELGPAELAERAEFHGFRRCRNCS